MKLFFFSLITIFCLINTETYSNRFLRNIIITNNASIEIENSYLLNVTIISKCIQITNCQIVNVTISPMYHINGSTITIKFSNLSSLIIENQKMISLLNITKSTIHGFKFVENKPAHINYIAVFTSSVYIDHDNFFAHNWDDDTSWNRILSYIINSGTTITFTNNGIYWSMYGTSSPIPYFLDISVLLHVSNIEINIQGNTFWFEDICTTSTPSENLCLRSGFVLENLEWVTAGTLTLRISDNIAYLGSMDIGLEIYMTNPNYFSNLISSMEGSSTSWLSETGAQSMPRYFRLKNRGLAGLVYDIAFHGASFDCLYTCKTYNHYLG